MARCCRAGRSWPIANGTSSPDPAASGQHGLKLTAQQVGQGIARRELSDPKLAMAVLDPSAFAVDGGPSPAEVINNELVKSRLATFRPADNRRVTSTADKRGPMAGWDAMRTRLGGNGRQPMLYFFSSCVAAIRTLPQMQHDEMKPEDLQTDSEDHAVDAIRYGCMARPWLRSDQREADEHPWDRAYGEMSDWGSMEDIGSSIKLL